MQMFEESMMMSNKPHEEPPPPGEESLNAKDETNTENSVVTSDADVGSKPDADKSDACTEDKSPDSSKMLKKSRDKKKHKKEKEPRSKKEKKKKRDRKEKKSTSKSNTPELESKTVSMVANDNDDEEALRVEKEQKESDLGDSLVLHIETDLDMTLRGKKWKKNIDKFMI
jgi:hypothetical protein